ncbi:hypothetical protein ACFPM0_24930 [Pseudonocardia sulfidoxydans]|uniref:hypothetical protein n=1 Tax=Pseudonocardia sulfidoxydans TaxID=54011 RepID=UPI003610C10C
MSTRCTLASAIHAVQALRRSRMGAFGARQSGHRVSSRATAHLRVGAHLQSAAGSGNPGGDLSPRALRRLQRRCPHTPRRMDFWVSALVAASAPHLQPAREP